MIRKKTRKLRHRLKNWGRKPELVSVETETYQHLAQEIRDSQPLHWFQSIRVLSRKIKKIPDVACSDLKQRHSGVSLLTDVLLEKLANNPSAQQQGIQLLDIEIAETLHKYQNHTEQFNQAVAERGRNKKENKPVRRMKLARKIDWWATVFMVAAPVLTLGVAAVLSGLSGPIGLFFATNVHFLLVMGTVLTLLYFNTAWIAFTFSQQIRRDHKKASDYQLKQQETIQKKIETYGKKRSTTLVYLNLLRSVKTEILERSKSQKKFCKTINPAWMLPKVEYEASHPRLSQVSPSPAVGPLPIPEPLFTTLPPIPELVLPLSAQSQFNRENNLPVVPSVPILPCSCA